MFKIVKQPRAWWPVRWTGITEEGQKAENSIELRFRLLKVNDFVDLMREVTERRQALAASADTKPDVAAVFAEQIERIADDWRGVAAENGEPLPWSRENLTLLMNEPGVFDRVMEAFQDVVAGGESIREGN